MKHLIIILISIMPLSTIAQDISDFYLEDIYGQKYHYSDLKGEKLTILDFWATWCKPCVNSIPKLIALSQQYDSTEVAFVGVNIDSPRNLSKVKPFAETLGINYPVILDLNQEVFSDLGISVIPTLVVLNENDEIVYLHEGYLPGDDKIIEAEINEILGYAKK